MFTSGGNANWIVAPEQRTIHVWLERPPSVVEWDEIETVLAGYVDTADRVELGGPGWSTARSRRMADILAGELETRGLTVECISPALTSTGDRR